MPYIQCLNTLLNTVENVVYKYKISASIFRNSFRQYLYTEGILVVILAEHFKTTMYKKTHIRKQLHQNGQRMSTMLSTELSNLNTKSI